ncbi:hypothetical protein FKW77_002539 [Venturia effusa]|uniref:Lysine-specific metallo-endopeptidase domain-containing protein n=1 Tax=Venturia effusa TaxID=50376 RepID=A0A517LC31_9PEZI|nr:hypothetical protein FKW77_002539 [Venturia effusa]
MIRPAVEHAIALAKLAKDEMDLMYQPTQNPGEKQFSLMVAETVFKLQDIDDAHCNRISENILKPNTVPEDFHALPQQIVVYCSLDRFTVTETLSDGQVWKFDPINAVKISKDTFDSYNAADSTSIGVLHESLGQYFQGIGQLVGAAGITIFPVLMESLQSKINKGGVAMLDFGPNNEATIHVMESVVDMPDEFIQRGTAFFALTGRGAYAPIDYILGFADFTILHELAHAWANGHGEDVWGLRSYGWTAVLRIQSAQLNPGERSSENCDSLISFAAVMAAMRLGYRVDASGHVYG